MSDKYSATLVYGYKTNAFEVDEFKEHENGFKVFEQGWGNGDAEFLIIGYELYSNNSLEDSDATEIPFGDIINILSDNKKTKIDSAAESVNEKCKIYLLWNRI